MDQELRGEKRLAAPGAATDKSWSARRDTSARNFIKSCYASWALFEPFGWNRYSFRCPHRHINTRLGQLSVPPQSGLRPGGASSVN